MNGLSQLKHRCGWRIANFDGAYVGQLIGKVTNGETFPQNYRYNARLKHPLVSCAISKLNVITALEPLGRFEIPFEVIIK